MKRRFSLIRGEFDVLATLRGNGEPYSLMPTELYRSTMLSSGAMSNRLDRLEERRLVRRSPDPGDRRGVLITLTEEGFDLVEEAVEVHVRNEDRLIGAIREDRARLVGLLRRLLVSMKSAGSGETKSSGFLLE